MFLRKKVRLGKVGILWDTDQNKLLVIAERTKRGR